MDNKHSAESEPVRLAREALERHIRDGQKTTFDPAACPPELTAKKAGVFVCLKKNGELRGCIGTIAPTTPSIAQEIMQNAISAGLHDPRFMPVTAGELGGLDINVDILGESEPVDSMEMLDPKRYGVIVSKGRRRGLLLPDLDGVDSVEQQLAIACSKAGIGPHEGYDIARFEVIRYS